MEQNNIKTGINIDEDTKSKAEKLLGIHSSGVYKNMLK